MTILLNNGNGAFYRDPAVADHSAAAQQSRLDRGGQLPATAMSIWPSARYSYRLDHDPGRQRHRQVSTAGADLCWVSLLGAPITLVAGDFQATAATTWLSANYDIFTASSIDILLE